MATSVLNEAQGQRQSESQGVFAATVAGLQMYADKSAGRDLCVDAWLDFLPATPLGWVLVLSAVFECYSTMSSTGVYF